MPALSITRTHPSGRAVARLMTEVAVASAGVVALACALVANQQYLDRHFLPSFLISREWLLRLETLGRLITGAIGVVLLFVVRPRVGRLMERSSLLALSIVVAVVLAFPSAELLLDRLRIRPAGWLVPDREPRRRPDAWLGWTLEPARQGRATIGGREIEYTLDASGYRVRRVDEPVDFERPTILFNGESTMFGEGLTWEESVPAQVGSMMGMQAVNLAVHGYASDQVYMRLRIELPRFRRPTAVVSLFMPALFGRNLNDDRPHIGPGLAWLSGRSHSRLLSLAHFLVPYRSEATVERGIHLTSEVLQATVDLARERGATPLVVVPQFGREEPMEQTLRRRILDQARLPYALVEIDRSWRLPGDGHPDPRAAHAIAVAIASRLAAAGAPAAGSSEAGRGRRNKGT